MPHIAKNLGRRQKNANIKRRQLLDNGSMTGRDQLKSAPVLLPSQQKYRLLSRGEPMIQFRDGNQIRRPRILNLQTVSDVIARKFTSVRRDQRSRPPQIKC
jgi:hypothetical protein